MVSLKLLELTVTAGPETVDRSMIGTTRRVNKETNTIEWTRIPSQGTKNNPDGKESVIYRLHPELEGRKLVFQIGTSDPERAVAAARIVAPDVAGIDVNAGCPKPFSTHDGMGAALLKTPDKLCAILEALVKNIVPEFEIGISVKIRLLENAADTEALVRRLCATGITGLTVHCRTTPMRPREPAIRGQLRMVADICRAAGVACLMNGDVEDREQALKLIDEFKVDGAMIATTAEKNSSCFRSGKDGGMAEWNEVTETYIKYAMDVGNKFGNTKYLLAQIIPGKAKLHGPITQAKSYTLLCKLLGLDHLEERARETDLKLDINPDGQKASKAGKAKNPSALAAGGQMAETRASLDQPRKSKAERGHSVSSEAQPASIVLPV
jgi:tRNA-dihydrouridine synthase 2